MNQYTTFSLNLLPLPHAFSQFTPGEISWDLAGRKRRFATLSAAGGPAEITL
jgi:hypothetical protein